MANLSNLSLDEYLLDVPNYLEVLKDGQSVQQVPLLNYANLQDFADKQLVRFRGMVQDIQDPEFFLESCELRVGKSVRRLYGRYRNVMVLRGDDNFETFITPTRYGKRRSLFLVSVPGLNDWAATYERSITPIPARSLRNSPLQGRFSRDCIATVYVDIDSFTLNSLVEVIGFLSVDPCQDFSSRVSEFPATNTPPTPIPRLHAIIVRRLTHYNPMLSANQAPLPNTDVSVYSDLLLVLTVFLFGDELAAQYLLCHLISTVYLQSGRHTLGQLSLNISNIPAVALPKYTKQLYDLLALLVPVSHLLPLTVENLNTLQFVPKKDNKTNKLTRGILQLAPHTNLVLDETQLLGARLAQSGIDAIDNINRLIQTQKLYSVFQFGELESNANVPLLCLSKDKSILSTDCHVPLRPIPHCIKAICANMEAAKHFLIPKLDAIRVQLTVMKLKEFNTNLDIRDMISTDFVEMIRIDNQLCVADLHSLSVLSRLLALCNGRSSLDTDMWQRAKTLEKLRKERITPPVK